MPKLLVVDDDHAVLQLLRYAFQGTDVDVETAPNAAQAVTAFHRRAPDAVVLGVTLPNAAELGLLAQLQRADPRVPVILVTPQAAAEVAIEAVRQGAFDYLVKPLDLLKTRELVGRALVVRRLTKVPVQVAPALDETEWSHDLLIGNCAVMQELYRAIASLATQAVSVLICGESGTGKELVARAIYQHGPRADKRLLALRCAATPEARLESELFGHERGAFPGDGHRRIGVFEQAHNATLLLDEIGDLSPLLQAKLLRALKEQQFERVGGTQALRSDVLVIATTNRNLEQMVADGRFRSDLYYCLSLHTIGLPPLRDHVADIPLLAEYYLHRFNRELGKTVTEISTAALEVLIHYPWPGNVRELQSVLKQSLLHATGEVLVPHFLPPRLLESARGLGLATHAAQSVAALDSFIDNELAAGTSELYAQTLAYMERTLLTRVLRHTSGNQSRAAKLLGITRGSLRNKIRLLRITIHPAVSVQSGPQNADNR